MVRTHNEQIVLAILPKISAFLAVTADLWIMTEVLTDNSKKPKRENPYHRLLAAMSLYGFLAGLAGFFSTWPVPRGTSNVFGAIGNQATCTAQGFFLSIYIAVPMYNAFLALYYVLVIKYGCTDDALRKRFEPAIHVFVFVFNFGIATYSIAFTDLINAANLWCWIAPFPSDCLDSWRFGDEGNCIRGDNAWIYRWAFYFAPLWACILFASKLILV
jgi:hypothetical protein